MEHSDLAIESDGYYKDNLLALCEALILLGDPANTGDWFHELVGYLKSVGSDSAKANVKPQQLALDIWNTTSKVNILEIMSLIRANAKGGSR